MIMHMMELLWIGFVGWFIGAPTIVKAPFFGVHSAALLVVLKEG